MTAPINGSGGTRAAAATQSSNFRASDSLQNGQFKLDFTNNEVAKSYGAFLGSLGESGGQAVVNRVEAKMTDWVKSHPGADQAALDKQLRSTLMQESMMQQMMKDSINKMMKDIEAKMKELAADRFG